MIITQNGRLIDQEIKIDFPIKIRRREYHEPGPIFKSHWHEEFMIFYIRQGRAIMHCNSKAIPVGAEDLIIMNSNDMHYAENLGSLPFIEYYINVYCMNATFSSGSYIKPSKSTCKKFNKQFIF